MIIRNEKTSQFDPLDRSNVKIHSG